MAIKPRLCHIVKGDKGYGFHLYGAKQSNEHFIRKVEDASPSSHAGLLTGDRIVAVNGMNVHGLAHSEVVGKIKEIADSTDLLVIDETASKYCKENNIVVDDEFLRKNETEVNSENVVEVVEDAEAAAVEEVEEPALNDGKPRPKLCKLVKKIGAGFGFNLHSEKGSSGKTISFVDIDGPGFTAGLKLNDRLVEVNGINVENLKHSKVVQAIKESGSKVELLVIDPTADNYYLRCHVTPASEHVRGEVPEPVVLKETANAARSDHNAGSDSVMTSGESNNESTTTHQFATDLMLNMDLNALKAKVQRNKKQHLEPAASGDAGWQDRKQIFNDL